MLLRCEKRGTDIMIPTFYIFICVKEPILTITRALQYCFSLSSHTFRPYVNKFTAQSYAVLTWVKLDWLTSLDSVLFFN